MNEMSIIINDFRYAIRQLVKSPFFTVVVILLLGFGIGANVTIFSMLNALKLRSIPVPKPNELHVFKWEGTPKASADNNFVWRLPNGDFTSDLFSYQNYCLFRDEVADTAQIMAMKALWWPGIYVKGQKCKGGAMWVSGNFFDGLKLSALFGRTLRVDDDRPDTASVAVISHSFWKNYFGGDPSALGESVTVNNNTFTVVGVLPQDFIGPEIGQKQDIYIPVKSQSKIEPVIVMARIPSGHEQKVREQCEALFQRVIFPIITNNAEKKLSIVFEDGARGRHRYTRYKVEPLRVLIPIMITILIVIVFNLTGLQLARCARRQHELSIRKALGAGRWRLTRQLLTESFLLVCIGTGLGLLLASWSKTAIAKLIWIHISGYDLRNDGLVLGFTLFISILTVLFFGALPALRSMRLDPLDGLREKAITGRMPLKLGKGLIIAQVGLAFLLLTGAGLFIRTSYTLTHVDKGFNTKNLLTFKIDPDSAGYKGEQLMNVNDQVAAAIEALPGVHALTRSKDFLVTGGGGMFGNARRKIVGSNYFTTMGIPLVRGRDFKASDEDEARKVILNELLAQELFPDEDPIGKPLPVPSRFPEYQAQVVGVCRNFKCFDVRKELAPAMFYHSRNSELLCYAVRTQVSPSILIPAIRQAVADIDSAVSLGFIMTQEERIHSMFVREQRLGNVACVAAFVAVSLLCLGLYGLQAYLVTYRTREIGVRLALGATRKQVVMPILRSSCILGVFGVFWGIPAALASMGIIRGYVWGVKLFDPVTLICSGILIFIVSLVAAYLPARRAAKIDPMEALRYE
ncbi:MAG: ABC transporter permease [Sedimentisphaerales bacterium]|nr:ABC transporter permease [Sedimentisphaerales bacterium]